jgi:hypothetical protein
MAALGEIVRPVRFDTTELVNAIEELKQVVITPQLEQLIASEVAKQLKDIEHRLKTHSDAKRK